MNELGLGQTLVSHNLRKLLSAGFITAKKFRNFRYYSLNRGFARPFLAAIDPDRWESDNDGRRLRAIIDQAPVTMTVLDRRGVFIFVGGEPAGMLGATEKQLLGRSVFKVYRDRQNVVLNMRRALKGHGVQWAAESGGRVFDVHSMPFRGDRGRLAGVISVVHDVTARVNREALLRKAEAEWRSLAEGSGDFLAHVDKDGIFLAVNHTVRGLLRDKVIGTSLLDYVPQDSRRELKTKLAYVFRTGREQTLRTKGAGPEKHALYECRMRPVRTDGGIVAVLVTARETTAGGGIGKGRK